MGRVPPHDRKRILRIHWHAWNGTKMGKVGEEWLRPERMVMGTKAKIRAEVHLPIRSWTPNDILVRRGIDKVSDDGSGLCIKRP